MNIKNIKNISFDFEFLNLLSKKEKDYLIETKTTLVYNKGEMICKQGAPISHIHILHDGLVKQYIENRNNHLIIRIASGDAFFGITSLFHDSTYHYSLSALKNTTISSIDINIFNSIINDNNEFTKYILKRLNNNNSHLYKRFFSITQKQLHGRIADAILFLSDNVFKSDSFDMGLSRKDIADLTGMSIESVIRVLKELNNDKIIELNGKELTIKSKKLLIKLSEIG